MPDPAGSAMEVADTGQALSAELGWLKMPALELHVALGEVLENVHTLAQPLAEQYQVPLEVRLPDSLADLPVPQLALRTILLTTLAVVIPRARPGAVLVTARRHGSEIELSITCRDRAAGQSPLSTKEAAGLEMARELAAFHNARLTIGQPGDAGLEVALFVAAPEQSTLLVIDDNADWIALLQRYLASTPFLVVGCNASEQAAGLAERLQPAVILLDVMMHHVDGWQVLSELRTEPSTSQIPVVICTVLPVEGMALSLGATAFLQKPVTQRQLLELLAQLEDFAA